MEVLVEKRACIWFGVWNTLDYDLLYWGLTRYCEGNAEAKA